MNTPVFFKPWARQHKWALWPAIFLVLLSGLVQFGLFALNANYVLSHFGAQPEDINFANQLTYAGIIATLTPQFRFLQYFERRSYLISVILFGMTLSIANIYVTNVYTFMALRLLTGMEVAMLAGCSLTLFFASVPAQKAPVIGSTIFYGTVITNVTLVGILSAWVTDNFDWQNIYRYLLLFQTVTLVLTLLVLNRRMGGRRYPLYQIDASSYVLFLSACCLLAYSMVYGPKYYWLEDVRIRWSLFLATLGFVLVITRQLRLKRPYLHPQVFLAKRFVPGLLLLLIYYGVKDSVNVVYAYCTIVVRWDNFDVMKIACVNLAGFLIFLFISAKLILSRKCTPADFFIPGFAVLLLYHVWAYRIITPDLSFADLVPPMFIQGAAAGLLFVPIILFMLSSLPGYASYTGIAVAAMARFVATLNSIAGYYTLQLYYNQLNKETFLRHTTNVDGGYAERLQQYQQLFRSKGFTADQATALGNANIFRGLTIQSQLLTDMHVFKLMIIVLVILLVVLIAVLCIRKLKQYVTPAPEIAAK